MTGKELAKLLDGEAWVEYNGNLYEYIGEQDGKHLFSDVNDGFPLPVSDKALRHSSEFYYTEKF